LVLGCASTVELNSTNEANTRIHGGSAIAHLQLKSGKEYVGRDVQVENDSIQFINTQNEDILRLSKQDIKFIKINDHTLGLVEGFFIGGTILGASGYIMGSKEDTEKGGVNTGFRTGITTIGAGIGGVIGIVIGGLSGHHYTYIFPKDSVQN